MHLSLVSMVLPLTVQKILNVTVLGALLEKIIIISGNFIIEEEVGKNSLPAIFSSPGKFTLIFNSLSWCFGLLF